MLSSNSANATCNDALSEAAFRISIDTLTERYRPLLKEILPMIAQLNGSEWKKSFDWRAYELCLRKIQKIAHQMWLIKEDPDNFAKYRDLNTLFEFYESQIYICSCDLSKSSPFLSEELRNFFQSYTPDNIHYATPLSLEFTQN